jgi:hypothetical protein
MGQKLSAIKHGKSEEVTSHTLADLYNNTRAANDLVSKLSQSTKTRSVSFTVENPEECRISLQNARIVVQILQADGTTLYRTTSLQGFHTILSSLVAFQSQSSLTNGTSKEKNDDDGLCCICMERKSNNVLPCCHSFCEECISAWHAGKIATCPLCRASNEGDAFEIIETPDNAELMKMFQDVIQSVEDISSKKSNSTHPMVSERRQPDASQGIKSDAELAQRLQKEENERTATTGSMDDQRLAQLLQEQENQRVRASSRVAQQTNDAALAQRLQTQENKQAHRSSKMEDADAELARRLQAEENHARIRPQIQPTHYGAPPQSFLPSPYGYAQVPPSNSVPSPQQYGPPPYGHPAQYMQRTPYQQQSGGYQRSSTNGPPHYPSGYGPPEYPQSQLPYQQEGATYYRN